MATDPGPYLAMNPAIEPKDTYWSRQSRALRPFGIWGAYIAVFVTHIIVRSFADSIFSPHSPAAIDRLIVGTNPAAWLQARIYGNAILIDKMATGAHMLWFAFPFAVGMYITVRRQDLLVRYFGWLTVAWFVCDVIFALVPASPPWMVDDHVTRILFTQGWVDYVGVDTNPVAAFPSLHACIPFVIGFFVTVNMREARWLAGLSFGFGLLVGASVIYIGEHWLVDVFAGYFVATSIAFGAVRLGTRKGAALPNAIAKAETKNVKRREAA